MAAYKAAYSVCVHTPGFGTPPPHTQHAGYKAPVEKWDTDSDSSDGSGDELDLAV